MARDNIPEYSATASANTVVADVNIDEGCAPSGINNAIREVMAALKDVDTGATTLTSPAFTSSTSATIKTATVKHTNDTTSMTIAANGGVTFSEVPSLPDNTVETADVQDNAITLAKMAGLTRGSIIYGNANGDPIELAVGTGVLTGDGTDISYAAPAAQVPTLTRGQIIYSNASGNTVALDPGTAGQVLQSDGTDISYVDSTSLGNTTAGGVGTYSLLGKSDGAVTSLGASVAGSSLRYASTYAYGPSNYGMSGTAPSGTWKAMSVGGAYNFSTAAGRATTVTLFLRIS
jgi:hypothetical protein